MVGEVQHTHVGAQVGALLRFDRQARTRCGHEPSFAAVVGAGRAAECVALRRFPTPSPTNPSSRQVSPSAHRAKIAMLGQDDGRRRACRPDRSAAAWPTQSAKFATALAVTVLSTGPGNSVSGGRLDHAGHVGQGAVLAADVAWQVHRMESRFRRIPATRRAIRRPRSNRMRRGSCRPARAGQRSG